MNHQLISSEWNYGHWAMFATYDRDLVADAYQKGYRYAEVRQDYADITFLRFKPKALARNTKVVEFGKNGNFYN